MGTRSSVLLFLLGLALAAPAATRAEPLRVMALGDSIAQGQGSSHEAGFRMRFWNRLHEASVDVDMVGGKTNGPETFDGRHQAYPGVRTYGISAACYEKVRKYQPDIVLLVVGSNDCCGDVPFNPLSFEVNFSVLLDRIFSAKRDVKLFVATAPPTKYRPDDVPKSVLNRVIRGYIKERTEESGEAIQVVDIEPLLDHRKDMADSKHPNDAGYEKIGDAFADAVLTALGRDPSA